MADKYQWFNDKKFTRDDRTGYYLNSTIHKRMHVYVWEYYNGTIPKGYEVHHIDFDRSNNDISNLQLLTKSEHKHIHAKLLTDEQRNWRRQNLNNNARPKAIEWHKSDEGRQWHKEHIQRQQEVLHHKVDKICVYCGKRYQGEVKSKFCSNACKSAYRRQSGVDLVERSCIICGTAFMANKYSDKECCSKRCSATLGHIRRNESKISKKDQ